jgi:hypothetical protein
MGKKDAHKDSHSEVEVFTEAQVGLNPSDRLNANGTNSSSANNLIINVNAKGLLLKQITFKVNEDELEVEKFNNLHFSLCESVSSPPKFFKKSEYSIQTNNTLSCSKILDFTLPVLSSERIEESARYFPKEKLADLKKNKASMLFTVKDPGHDEEVRSILINYNI